MTKTVNRVKSFRQRLVEKDERIFELEERCRHMRASNLELADLANRNFQRIIAMRAKLFHLMVRLSPLVDKQKSDLNIALGNQTTEQLINEYQYWDRKIRAATGWGASLAASQSFKRGAAAWLVRRLKEELDGSRT